MEAPYVECSFLLPDRPDSSLSDAKQHSRRVLSWFRKELFSGFEGATLAPGMYEGFYPDPDTGLRVRDRSRRYFMALPAERLDGLREFLREVCRRFSQKCIYLSVAGKVEFVRP